MIDYINTHIEGYNGLKIKIEAGFKDDMDRMNIIARECSVTVIVTKAYREEGQNIGGTVVPISCNKGWECNILVGHGIEFNLQTPIGVCNGDCLMWETNSYARV